MKCSNIKLEVEEILFLQPKKIDLDNRLDFIIPAIRRFVQRRTLKTGGK